MNDVRGGVRSQIVGKAEGFATCQTCGWGAPRTAADEAVRGAVGHAEAEPGHVVRVTREERVDITATSDRNSNG